MMTLIELMLGFIIGISLGLLGGGGSILTVPALVYLVGQTPQAAVTTSLIIVGTNSLAGAILHGSQGRLNWKVALTFGGAGMLVSYPAAGLSRHMRPEFLLMIFAFLMLGIGVMLLLPRREKEPTGNSIKPLPIVILGGAFVGLLTGLLGVGGGFRVVPALVLWVGLPVQVAVGTSLVVIAMNSIAGLLGHSGHNTLDLMVVLAFTLAGLAGTLIGTKVSSRLSSSQLQRAFAVFVIGLAFFVLWDNLYKVLSL